MGLVRVCDICGSRSKVKNFYFETGKTTDAAGSMESVGVQSDLCAACVSDIFESIVRSKKLYNWDIGKFVVEKISQKIKSRVEKKK